jgi:hypothetical protein
MMSWQRQAGAPRLPHSIWTSGHLDPYNHQNMSTIASPRPSVSIRSPSSTRTSFDNSARAPPNPRRNRAALRDYYGLKNTPADADADTKTSEETARTGLGPEEDETLTELDAAEFDADAFVDALLAKEGLQGVLKVEADLVSRMSMPLPDTPTLNNMLIRIKRYATSTATASHSSTTTTPSCSRPPAPFDACVAAWTPSLRPHTP